MIESVYEKFAIYGGFLIKDLFEGESLSLNSKEMDVIDDIIEKNAKMRPWQLVEKSHIKDGAWDKIWKDGVGNKNIIPFEFIEEEANRNAI